MEEKTDAFNAATTTLSNQTKPSFESHSIGIGNMNPFFSLSFVEDIVFRDI